MKKELSYSERKYKLKLTFKEKTIYIDIGVYRDYRKITGKDLDSDIVEQLFNEYKIDPKLPEDKLSKALYDIIQELKKPPGGYY